MKLKFASLFIVVHAVTIAFGAFAQADEPKSKVVLAANIRWEQLNPARGAASPKAATLWGDRKGTVATGFLVQFVDGFSSPPHIHNVSYRGLVIVGGIHNDDPGAELMWMPTGSYWTQPAGEVHITSSRGAGMAYIEIESGPYLVMPVEEASDSGKRPVNVDPSNLVWLGASNTSLIERATNSPEQEAQITYLWGKPNGNNLYGTLVKLPSGYSGELRSDADRLQAVVIEGQTDIQVSRNTKSQSLTAGSYVASNSKVVHKLECKEDACLIYIRAQGHFSIRSN